MAVRPTGPQAPPSSRARGLDVGVTGVDRWRESDEVHLPDAGRAAPAFLPDARPLDDVLRRRTLDERLVEYLVPEGLDPELLSQQVLTDTRERAAGRFALAADRGGVPALDRAADLLDREISLDAEVREALAALLRG